MKIKPEHFAELQKAINETLAKHNANNELVECYERGEFSNSDRTKNLQRRFCFDVLYGSGVHKLVCDVLYKYMNDDHIYTALKAMCPRVERKY